MVLRVFIIFSFFASMALANEYALDLNDIQTKRKITEYCSSPSMNIDFDNVCDIYGEIDETDFHLFLGGLSLLAIDYYLINSKMTLTISDLNNINSNEVPFYDRSSLGNFDEAAAQASDIYLTMNLFLPLGLKYIGLEYGDSDNLFGKYSLMYLEALGLSLGINNFFKATVDKKRPYVYNKEVDDDLKMTSDAMMSFFSGHVVSAFTAATFLTKVIYDNSDGRELSLTEKLVIGSSYSLASYVSYLRLKAGKHYPSDVVIGALTGIAVGYLVPELNLKNEDGSSVINGHSDSQGNFGFRVHKKF